MLSFILVIVFIIIAVCLVWFLMAHDHGEKEPAAMLWLAAGLGAGGAAMAGLIENHLIPVANLQPGATTGTLAWSVLAVGLIEESIKFLPLALIIYPKRFFNEHTDGIIYFAVVGLGFGVPENILYTVQFGSAAGLPRLLLTPIFHGAITALVGYFLVLRKVDKKPLYSVVLAFCCAVFLHSLYDFGLTISSPALVIMSLITTFGLSGSLFFLYFVANQQDQDKALAAVGHNSFCRSCGKANPRHHLHCLNCGKIA